MAGVWTDNWRGMKNAMMMGAVYPGLSTVRDSRGNTITHAPVSNYCDFALSPLGNQVRGSVAAMSGGVYCVSNNGYGACIVLGDGASVIPAASDYALGNVPLIQYLSVASGALRYDTASGRCGRTYTVHIQNNGAAAVTLTEWGLFATVGTVNADTNGTYRSYVSSYPVLIYHAALDTPITLQPGASAAVELTLELTLDDPV